MTPSTEQMPAGPALRRSREPQAVRANAVIKANAVISTAGQ